MTSPQKNTARRPLILHAEDQPMVAEAVQLILSQSGYDVDVVGDGAEALRRLSAQGARYDLIITDVSMPVLDGWGLIERLPETGYRGPVIVLSAFPGDGLDGLPLPNVAAVIPKPFQIQKLLSTVVEALSAHNPSAARDSASSA